MALSPGPRRDFIPSTISIWNVLPSNIPSLHSVLNDELLDEIKRPASLKIQFVTNSKSTLKLQGTHPATLSQAVLDVKISVEAHDVTGLSDYPVFIVCGNHGSTYNVSRGVAGRPVISAQVEPSRPMDPSQVLDFEQQLCSVLAPAIQSAGTVGLGLQMRVKFGHIKLKEAKKGKKVYTSAELRDLFHVLAPRGTACFERRLVAPNASIQKLQSLISSPDNAMITSEFRPAMPGITTLELWCSNIVVEADITMPRWESTTFSRAFEQQDRNFVDVVVAKPERNIDWNLVLEMRQHVPMDDSLRNLLHERVWCQRDQKHVLDIPKAVLIALFEKGDKIILKNRTTLPFRSFPYVLQFTESRLWKTASLPAEYEEFCEIDFFCPWWDEVLMGAKTRSKRGVWWTEMSNNLLPGPPGPFDAQLKSFLHEIEKVLNILDGD